MLFTSIFTFAAAIAGIAAIPQYKIPTADGFPNPNPAQLTRIEQMAGGALPNGPLPNSLKKTGVTTLQLIALNELFEVAFFTDLLSKVVNSTSGYKTSDIAPLDKAYVVKTLSTIVEVSSCSSSPYPLLLSS